ncbi:hypothetical protein [Lacunisphaera limnophila]|uniref:hypothetical protein n=1 Tax=Lacunisphaera limnophila TaxID=1838286 RepID=UPI0012FD6071|nr:hypothetical protein [Lacunisphaera limnophila]
MRLQIKLNRSLQRELAPGDRRLWLLRSVALRIERHTNPLWVFEVYHRRLLLALGVLALVGYFLLATALYVWLDRKPHNQVAWFDLAAPWRWSGLQAKRGDTAIEAGLEQLRLRNYPDAFYQLRVGLARSPANIEGRLTLARLFAGSDPTRALTLLEDGLAHAPGDERLVALLLEFYTVLQVQERALATVDRLLATAPQGRVRFMLERARVTLLLQLQRYSEAEAALAAVSAPAAAEEATWRSLRLELLLRTGRAAQARPGLDALLADGTPALLLRQVGEVAVALDDAALLQSVVRRLQAREPEAPGPYLFAIQAWHRLKRVSPQANAEREYLQLFAGNDSALQALAALAVNLDQPDLVNRVRQAAASARLSQFAYRVHLTEIALRRGDTDTAMRTLRDWESGVETLPAQQRFYPEFIRRLARGAFAGTPDQVTSVLGHLAANRFQARLQIYDLAITVFEKSGHAAAADQLARAGLQVYPYSAPLLAAGQRLAAGEAARAATAVTSEAAASGPEASLPLTGPLALAELDRRLAADELAPARDFLRAVRSQRPAWLPAFEAAVAARDVELTFLAIDAIAGRTAARSYLDRHRSEDAVLGLVAVTGRLAGRGRLTDARLLYDEIAASPAATGAVTAALSALALPDDSATQTASETAAVAAFDRFIAAADWAQAERLLRQLRDKPPEWLAAGASEVKTREVVVRLGLDQRPLALAALKELVVKGGAARGAAFRLVRDMLARGEQDQAIVLAREILKLLPGDPAATRLLQEAEAPRPTGP